MSKKVLAETSARHIHLTQEAVEALYGAGAKLEPKKMLSQPDQFAAANDKIKVVGPKGELMLSVLGPTRKANQVELSYSDARVLGLKSVPVRESGDIAGSGACKLVNPDTGAELELTEGVIAAKRHIHLTPEAAAEMGVSDKEIVSVKIESERTTVFGDVVIRVSEKFAPAMHIDTDESNAALCKPGTMGVILYLAVVVFVIQGVSYGLESLCDVTLLIEPSGMSMTVSKSAVRMAEMTGATAIGFTGVYFKTIVTVFLYILTVQLTETKINLK